jgi:hypothetical protein
MRLLKRKENSLFPQLDYSIRLKPTNLLSLNNNYNHQFGFPVQHEHSEKYESQWFTFNYLSQESKVNDIMFTSQNGTYITDWVILSNFAYLLLVSNRCSKNEAELRLIISNVHVATHQLAASPKEFFCLLLKRFEQRFWIALCYRNVSQIELVEIELEDPSPTMNTIGRIVESSKDCSGRGVAACSWNKSELCVAWKSGHFSIYNIYGKDVEGNCYIEELSSSLLLVAAKVVAVLPIEFHNDTISRWIVISSTSNAEFLLPTSGSETTSIFQENTLVFSQLFPKTPETKIGSLVSLISYDKEFGKIAQSNEVYCHVVNPRVISQTLVSDRSEHFYIALSNHIMHQFVLMELRYYADELELINEEQTVAVSDNIKHRVLGLQWANSRELLVVVGVKDISKKTSPFFFASLDTLQSYKELELHRFIVESSDNDILSPPAMEQEAITASSNNQDAISLIKGLRDVILERFNYLEQSIASLQKRMDHLEKVLTEGKKFNTET